MGARTRCVLATLPEWPLVVRLFLIGRTQWYMLPTINLYSWAIWEITHITGKTNRNMPKTQHICSLYLFSICSLSLAFFCDQSKIKSRTFGWFIFVTKGSFRGVEGRSCGPLMVPLSAVLTMLILLLLLLLPAAHCSTKYMLWNQRNKGFIIKEIHMTSSEKYILRLSQW